MPLVLTGIIAAEDPQNGLAILGQTAASAKVYAVGDNVPGGAKLHSVYSDRVVIDRGGHAGDIVPAATGSNRAHAATFGRGAEHGKSGSGPHAQAHHRTAEPHG